MQGRNILADDFVPETKKKGRNILADDFAPKENKNFLKDLFERFGRESIKSALSGAVAKPFSGVSESAENLGAKIGYGAIPAYENLLPGIAEGAKGAYAGLTGTEFTPEVASEEYGAGFGRGLGQMLGQGAVAAPLAAAASTGLGAVGVPALVSALGGTALGFGATTQGNLLDRLISGGEAAALHGAGKGAKFLMEGRLPVKSSLQKLKTIFEVPKLRENARLNESALEEATDAETALLQQNKANKFSMETEPGIESSNPATLRRKENIAREEKARLESELAESPEMDVSKNPPKPLIEDEEILGHEENLENLKEAHEAKAKEIKDFLGEGLSHRKRTANILNPILEKRQKEVGGLFNKFRDDLSNKNVQLPVGRSEKAILKDITERYKQGDTSSKEVEALKNELITIGKANEIPANTFVDAYRSLKQLAGKVRASAYGKDAQEFTRITDSADAMDVDVRKMEEILDKNLGKDSRAELNKIKSRYANEIAPLFENKFYQALLSKSKAPSNMIEALTEEPYKKSHAKVKVTGRQILDPLIKNDPQLLKHVIGEKAAKDPDILHSKNELLDEYVKHMPELQKLISEHAELKTKINETSKTLKKLTKEKKLTEPERKRREHVVSLFEKVEGLNERAMRLEEAYKEAESMADQEGISLENKMKLKAEAKKSKAAYEEARAARNKAVSVLGGTAIGGLSLNAILRKMGLY